MTVGGDRSGVHGVLAGPLRGPLGALFGPHATFLGMLVGAPQAPSLPLLPPSPLPTLFPKTRFPFGALLDLSTPHGRNVKLLPPGSNDAVFYVSRRSPTTASPMIP